jgi:hypothetical protein
MHFKSVVEFVALERDVQPVRRVWHPHNFVLRAHISATKEFTNVKDEISPSALQQHNLQ